MAKRWTAVSLMIVASLVGGCGKDEPRSGTEELGVPVEVIEVTAGNLRETLSLTGDIRPWQEVKIVPAVPGKVVRIYVDEDDMVEEHQLLAELDTRAAGLRLEQAEAGLAVAQASFNSASRDWERMQELHQRGTITPQQYEKVQLAHEAAEAQLQQARSGLNLARHQLEISSMRAPFKGVITAKGMNEGEYINPAMAGSGPRGASVVTLMDLSRVKIRVSVSERDMTKIRAGQRALITVDTYPGKEFAGEISRVSPTAHPMSRAFGIEITVQNKAGELKAGMYARVEIITQERKDVPVISIDAVLAGDDHKYVYVANNAKAAKRLITLGLQQGSFAEITEGLDVGEKIVSTGKEMIEDGSTLTLEGGNVK